MQKKQPDRTYRTVLNFGSDVNVKDANRTALLLLHKNALIDNNGIDSETVLERSRLSTKQIHDEVMPALLEMRKHLGSLYNKKTDTISAEDLFVAHQSGLEALQAIEGLSHPDAMQLADNEVIIFLNSPIPSKGTSRTHR